MAAQRCFVVLVALGVLCTGCGSHLHVAASEPSPIPTPPATASQSSSPSPYVDPPRLVAQLADRFVQTALSYDSPAEMATAFINRLRPITTSAELDRLRRSARAHLDWRALRARRERTSVQVTGTSTATSPAASATDAQAQQTRVVVEAERTTVTAFGAVRDFIEVRLQLIRAGSHWRVWSATGGGL